VPARLRLVVPHGVMLLVAVALYAVASRIDVDTGGRISPAAWPKAIVVIMGILCLYEIVRRLVVSRPRAATGLLGGLHENPAEFPAAPAAGDQDASPAEPRHHAKLFSGIALIAGYVVLAPWLGFFVATALFLAVFPWIGGFRRAGVIAALALAGTFSLLVIFMRVAYISLPLGEGPFRAFSLALLRLIGVS